MFYINQDSAGLFTVCRDQQQICSKVTESIARQKVEALGCEFVVPSEPDVWQEVPECKS